MSSLTAWAISGGPGVRRAARNSDGVREGTLWHGVW